MGVIWGCRSREHNQVSSSLAVSKERKTREYADGGDVRVGAVVTGGAYKTLPNHPQIPRLATSATSAAGSLC